MNTSTILPFPESENGNYIIIKVPRTALQQQEEPIPLLPLSFFLSFRKTIWIFLCIFCFLMGIALGSIFHDRILHETIDKPIWKSSSLQSPE
jgi:hypothetical protein